MLQSIYLAVAILASIVIMGAKFIFVSDSPSKISKNVFEACTDIPTYWGNPTLMFPRSLF